MGFSESEKKDFLYREMASAMEQGLRVLLLDIGAAWPGARRGGLRYEVYADGNEWPQFPPEGRVSAFTGRLLPVASPLEPGCVLLGQKLDPGIPGFDQVSSLGSVKILPYYAEKASVCVGFDSGCGMDRAIFPVSLAGMGAAGAIFRMKVRYLPDEREYVAFDGAFGEKYACRIKAVGSDAVLAEPFVLHAAEAGQ